MATEKISAQQRAVNFAALTRQYYQMSETHTINGGAQNVEIRIPSVRILQGIRLYVYGNINAKESTSGSHALGDYDIYRMLRNIRLNFNNNFAPITISGYEKALLNATYPNGGAVTGALKSTASIATSASGVSTPFSFMLDLPLTINYRDLFGLILAQNKESIIELALDFDDPRAVVKNASGVTATYENVKIVCEFTTFSIPKQAEAFPDLSVLKIEQSNRYDINIGNNEVRLPTGMIYRKLLLLFEDSSGTALSTSQITSDMELILNTADTNYKVSPDMLRMVNALQLGFNLPTGVYAFLLDWQGIPSMGGSRDYIDTAKITELSLRFNSSAAGRLTAIQEKLSPLIAG